MMGFIRNALHAAMQRRRGGLEETVLMSAERRIEESRRSFQRGSEHAAAARRIMDYVAHIDPRIAAQMEPPPPRTMAEAIQRIRDGSRDMTIDRLRREAAGFHQGGVIPRSELEELEDARGPRPDSYPWEDPQREVAESKRTKLRIISDGTPGGTRLVTEDGAEIENVVSVSWSVVANDVAHVDVEMSFVEIEAAGGRVQWLGPRGRPVRRVVYDDGTTEDF